MILFGNANPPSHQQQAPQVFRGSIVDVGTGTHATLPGLLSKAKVIKLALEGCKARMAEVFLEHLRFEAGGVVHYYAFCAAVPFDHVRVGPVA
mmetsp:Transcript_13407/g.19609  ORF Transcript_13407/g.19609 Transcript_13407/m.19609 type:complete len:93 (-) Transcript_13407:263-541(-)